MVSQIASTVLIWKFLTMSYLLLLLLLVRGVPQRSHLPPLNHQEKGRSARLTVTMLLDEAEMKERNAMFVRERGLMQTLSGVTNVYDVTTLGVLIHL